MKTVKKKILNKKTLENMIEKVQPNDAWACLISREVFLKTAIKMARYMTIKKVIELLSSLYDAAIKDWKANE